MSYILSSIMQIILLSPAIQGALILQPPSPTTPSSLLSTHRKIPGDSPLRLCHESRDTDLYSISSIELSPNPLHIDDVFEIHLYGTFLQNITTNATFTYLARYGNSTEHESGVMDFCTTMDSIDQPDPQRERDCPPEKGFALISMSAWVMPMFIVPGDYYFKFDAVTKEGERIYCLDTEIRLNYRDKHGGGGEDDAVGRGSVE